MTTNTKMKIGTETICFTLGVNSFKMQEMAHFKHCRKGGTQTYVVYLHIKSAFVRPVFRLTIAWANLLSMKTVSCNSHVLGRKRIYVRGHLKCKCKAHIPRYFSV